MTAALRKILLTVLCLALAAAQPAYAQEGQDPAGLSRLQPFLDVIADTAQSREIVEAAMGRGEDPSLSYGIIYRLLYRQLVSAGVTEEGVTVLTEDALAALYLKLFAAGDFIMPQEDCCDMILRTENGLAFDVSTALASLTGTQVMLMDMEEKTGRLRVVAELYRSPEDFYTFSTEDLETADWFGTAEFQLQRDEQSLFGYTLIAYHQYQDGAQNSQAETLLEYEDAKNGFFLRYPQPFEGLLVPLADGVTATLPDQSASFTARRLPGGDGLIQAAHKAQGAHPQGELAVYEEKGYFTLYWQEEGRCHYVISYPGPQSQYTVELTYGAQAEPAYAPYQEYMENSFTVYEFAVG